MEQRGTGSSTKWLVNKQILCENVSDVEASKKSLQSFGEKYQTRRATPKASVAAAGWAAHNWLVAATAGDASLRPRAVAWASAAAHHPHDWLRREREQLQTNKESQRALPEINDSCMIMCDLHWFRFWRMQSVWAN